VYLSTASNLQPQSRCLRDYISAAIFTLWLISPHAGAAEPSVDVYEASIAQLQQSLTTGRATSHQLVQAYLARINAYDQQGPALNSIVLTNPHALADADRLDAERRKKGPRGPLHGIPVVVKDNYDTADMPTSGGTLALANSRPDRDAYQIQRLRDAGAIILGKATMHELAAGVTTVSSLTGYTHNPYDPARNPGGSSGGTAASVAASFAAAGMGSDTCGSLRIPAAFQGLVSLRTTRGLASRTGVMPLSSTQDVAGPLARSVEDLAVMLDATVGVDPADVSTAQAARHIPQSYLDGLSADSLKDARIGVIRSLFGSAPEDAEVTAVINKALDLMKAQGATVIDVSIPELDALLRDSSIIPYEFKYDLAAYLANHPGTSVKSLSDIIDRGMDHQALDAGLRLRNSIDISKSSDQDALKKVQAKRIALKALMIEVISANRLTALAYPTIQRKPALIGELQGGATNCQLSATTGLPAMAIPAGRTPDELPIGLELLGTEFAEPQLLNLAYGWEKNTAARQAPFSTPRLVNGKAPKPVQFHTQSASKTGPAVKIDFEYAPTTGLLNYRLTTSNVTEADMVAVTLQRRGAQSAGPILWSLAKPHHLTAEGSVLLKGQDKDALLKGDLLIKLYTAQAPLGAPH